MARMFGLIGDSNVKRNMSPTSCRDPLMLSSQVIQCGRIEVFKQSLKNIKSEVDVVIVSCFSNFLSSSEETSESVGHRIDPVLDEAFRLIVDECVLHPGRKYLVSPPMYRLSPLWYRDGMSAILSKFSSMARVHAQPNLRLLPSFSSPVLEKDGVHLTPFSGLEFVLHLFDSAKLALETLDAPLETRQVVVAESTRLLEDRVVALEQDHRRLSSECDLNYAIQAEANDAAINERNEDSFIISGLARISGRLSGKDWQTKAKSDVLGVIVTLMGTELGIEVVHNSTGPSPSALVTYSVQMSRVEDAKAIRSRFGKFFSGGRDSRPPSLSQISIQNLVTRATRVRISIMKLLGKRYEARNPSGRSQVIGYLPRPVLKLFPPPEAKSKRILTFSFIKAIQKLPTDFTRDEIIDITKRAAQRFPGKLRSLFVVLSDDMVPPATRSKRPGSPSGQQRDGRRARVVDEFVPEDV